MHSWPAGGSASIETVYNAQLVDTGSQSWCTVNVVKLDWESVRDDVLVNLAATTDCVIATGLIHVLRGSQSKRWTRLQMCS